MRDGATAKTERLALEVEREGPALDDERERLALEDERDFCLRSLRDLDAERDAGDIDPRDYESLRQAYVARAAVALRALGAPTATPDDSLPADPDGGPDRSDRPDWPGADAADVGASSPGAAEETPPRKVGSASRSRRRAVLAVIGVAIVAGLASWSVVRTSTTRLPGQEITGQSLGTETVARSLQQAEQAIGHGDDVTAMKDYHKVLQADPSQPEALTGAGWLLAQTQQPALVQQGLTMLASAEQADASYAPAHLYRGVTLLSEDDYTGAIPELQWYLGHNPDPQLAPRVRQALQQAEAKAAAAAKAGG